MNPTLIILFGTFMMSVLVYVGVSFVVVVNPTMEQDQKDMMLIIFLMLSATSCAGSFLLPRLTKQSLLSGKIFSWALAESIAVYGLVYFLTSGSHIVMFAFSAWAIATMICHHPFTSHSEKLY